MFGLRRHAYGETFSQVSDFENTHGICHAEFAILDESGKSMLAAVISRIRYVSILITESEHMSATNQENQYIPPLTIFPDRMSLLIIRSIKPISTAFNRFN